MLYSLIPYSVSNMPKKIGSEVKHAYYERVCSCLSILFIYISSGVVGGVHQVVGLD